MSIFRRIKFWLKEVKWKFQRFHRGYSDADVWGIFDWFIDSMIPMLQQFKENLYGHPAQFKSEDEWVEQIQHMIDLLEIMKDDSNHLDDEMIKAKDEFFELFSKYFYNLWD